MVQENKSASPVGSLNCHGVNNDSVQSQSAVREFTSQDMAEKQTKNQSDAMDEINGKTEIVESFRQVEVSETNLDQGQVVNAGIPSLNANTIHQEPPNQIPNPPDNNEADSVSQSQAVIEQEAGDQLEAHQARFSQGMRSYCRLVDPSWLLGLANPHVRSLTLERAPAGLGFPFRQLLTRLTGITELNLSGNQLGPQAFRVITLGMCHNKTIKTLDISNNCTDTDSSECLGKMLSANCTLVRLDVSSNQLGRDFFSRCIGPSLGSNTTLKTLRASSCGFTDLDVMMDNLTRNGTLEELDVSHNQMRDSNVFSSNLKAVLQSPTCRLRSFHLRNCGLQTTA
ncbi:leucine-rich repeat-containing protein 74B-like [Patiria miniata]|uniref:Uncharacterized protein n=1 Tax=Patiria miniata TaxID=46514 RepID=A0A914A3Q5_PATMI|nr:leucine-rich repeat-containing protein 74B-like [Patiria miniata]XP_038058472.1 leucine-rich repeat-containing protein 74B-like [Patiria miniata]XP_038058473.1 leucine-rich repeat-containing protein 74B-like [Patiria miniata]XP_038058474.1 leucine-rich repeat-containing protein 74B-like [Patiria miniata]XP_038058475.1 leucine-rich repeat-containing protein 74B-like [Patiria miniata]